MYARISLQPVAGCGQEHVVPVEIEWGNLGQLF